MSAKDPLAGLHSQFLHSSSNFVAPSQHRLADAHLQCNMSSLAAAKPPHGAVHNRCRPALLVNAQNPGNKPSLVVSSQPSQFAGSNTSVALSRQDTSVDGMLRSLTATPGERFAAQAIPGPHVSPSRAPLPLTAQLMSARPVRRSAAYRSNKYTEHLGSSSESDSSPSKARASKPKGVQRTRRPNSKPARFCEASESEDDLDHDGNPPRKHHNPW